MSTLSVKASRVVRRASAGLYCEAGGFFVDPVFPVDVAVITHAHFDHFCPGCRVYYTAAPGAPVLRHRLGGTARVIGIPYGESWRLGGTNVSFHPAGHILGSAQVRIENKGRVAVVTGDYKIAPDATCTAFETVNCDEFITETTFGLPEFAWPAVETVVASLHAWWRTCQQKGEAAVVCAYALGKAQRLLAAIDSLSGPIFVHADIAELNPFYEAEGTQFPEHRVLAGENAASSWGDALMIVPPNFAKRRSLTVHGKYQQALVSGWTQRPTADSPWGPDCGFVFSDHADYNELLLAVERSQAEWIGTIHGSTSEFAADLVLRGYDAESLAPTVPA